MSRYRFSTSRVPLWGGDSGAVTAIATGTSVIAGSSSAGQRSHAYGRRRYPFPGRRVPTLARHVSEHARRLAVDRDHHVVERRIGSVAYHSTRLVGSMLRRVPALAGQVDASAKRDRIVDDDDLLVVRAAREDACYRTPGGRADAVSNPIPIARPLAPPDRWRRSSGSPSRARRYEGRAGDVPGRSDSCRAWRAGYRPRTESRGGSCC